MNVCENYYVENKWHLLGTCCTLDQLVVLALQQMAATVNLEIFQDNSKFWVSTTLVSSTCGGVNNAVPGCVFRWNVVLERIAQTNSDLVIAKVPGYGNLATSTMNVTNFQFYCVGCDGVIPNDNSVVDYCGVYILLVLLSFLFSFNDNDDDDDDRCNGKNASCTNCFGQVVAQGQPIYQYDVCGTDTFYLPY